MQNRTKEAAKANVTDFLQTEIYNVDCEIYDEDGYCSNKETQIETIRILETLKKKVENDEI